MTKRMYYSDSYTAEFEAYIVERLTWNGRPALIFDHTYFYPTSGGQPHDTGQVNGVDVLDVEIRPDDEAILHIVAEQPAADRVKATIDWQRRFDHMQHHTGQHILSQAFINISDAQTIGFHLSPKSVTIDLDQVRLTEGQIRQAEQLTNEIIWQNRPVRVQMATYEEVKSFPIRKIPAPREGHLRLIEISEFDLTACGGTHVSRTGEIGLLKIVKSERRGEKRRIEFRCGQRALDAFRENHEILEALKSEFTTGSDQIISDVTRLREENKTFRRQLKQQQITLAQFEAQRMTNEGEKHQGFTLISQVFTDRDPGQVRILSQQIVELNEAIVLFGHIGERSQLIFSRSSNAPGNMERILKTALGVLGSRSGGGNDTFAQGVAPAIEESRLQEAIDIAKKNLLGEIGLIG